MVLAYTAARAGAEGHQLLAASVRERPGTVHVVHDREPRELGHHHGCTDRRLIAADLLSEERNRGVIEVPMPAYSGRRAVALISMTIYVRNFR